MKLRAQKNQQASAQTVKKVEEGAMLPWHRVALNEIWTKRHCTPSIKSRRAWAAARNINPTHVNRFFWVKKGKAKRKKEKLDVENENYDLNVEEGGLEEIIIKQEIKEETAPVVPATPQPSNSRLNFEKSASKTARSPLIPSVYQNYRHYIIPTSTPDLTSSDSSFFDIPLGVALSSSSIIGGSFFSPSSLLTSSSDYSDHLIWEPSSPPASRWKRKISDAYMDLPSKKTRIWKARLSPISPSRPHRRGFSPLNTALVKEDNANKSIKVKQEVTEEDIILGFLPSNHAADHIISKEAKLAVMDDSSLDFLSSQESVEVLSSKNSDRESLEVDSNTHMLLPSAWSITSVPSTPTRSSSRLPASSPVLSSSPRLPNLNEHKDDPIILTVVKTATPRPGYDKDDFCCFCGLTDMDEGQHTTSGYYLNRIDLFFAQCFCLKTNGMDSGWPKVNFLPTNASTTTKCDLFPSASCKRSSH